IRGHSNAWHNYDLGQQIEILVSGSGEEAGLFVETGRAVVDQGCAQQVKLTAIKGRFLIPLLDTERQERGTLPPILCSKTASFEKGIIDHAGRKNAEAAAVGVIEP